MVWCVELSSKKQKPFPQKKKMPNHKNPINYHYIFLLLLLHSALPLNNVLLQVNCKSTIEPCSGNDKCNALLGYTLYTDLKVSEVASIFQIDPIDLLAANAIDISYPDIEEHILPSQLFIKVPITCSCHDGIRKSVSINYRTQPSDTLSSIADSIYGGLVFVDQLIEANSINDSSVVIEVGQNLVVPLPCTCFNGSDDSLPAVYLSYVVQPVDTLATVAATYFTTVTDLMNVNSMGTTDISNGDILAVPIPACASKFSKHASDFGLLVPNGSYAISASHCVQCSCGPQNLDLYCMPASLPVSCSSFECKNSNLMLGNVTVQHTSGGCNVTSCRYRGFVNGSIVTRLSSTLQPQCPGPHKILPLIAPPTHVMRDLVFAPSPLFYYDGIGAEAPESSAVPATGLLPGFPPANSPTSAASTLMNPLHTITFGFLLLFAKLIILAAF